MSNYSNYPYGCWYSWPYGPSNIALGGPPNLNPPNPFHSNPSPHLPPNPCQPLPPNHFPPPLPNFLNLPLMPNNYPGYTSGSPSLSLNTGPPLLPNHANPFVMSNNNAGYNSCSPPLPLNTFPPPLPNYLNPPLMPNNYPGSPPLSLNPCPPLLPNHVNPFVMSNNYAGYNSSSPPLPLNTFPPQLPNNLNPLIMPNYYPGHSFGSQPQPLNTCPPLIPNILNPFPLANYYSGYNFGFGVGVGTVAAATNQIVPSAGTTLNPSPNTTDPLTSTSGNPSPNPPGPNSANPSPKPLDPTVANPSPPNHPSLLPLPFPPPLNFNLGPVASPCTGSSFGFGPCRGPNPITCAAPNPICHNPCLPRPSLILNCNPCQNHCSPVCVSNCVCASSMTCGPNSMNVGGPNSTNFGNSKYSSGETLPTEIIDSADDKDWQAMVNDFSQRGKFKNCLAVCDVSGSMTGTPMDVCVALGLLVSELCDAPWKGKVVTYNTAPELLTIQGKSIQEKKDWMIKMPWTEELDLKKVFEKIIELAEKENLSKQKMIKRLFIFTDLEFDKSAGQTWVSDYKEIQNMYNLAGYSGLMPEIVFWNIHEEKETVKTGSRNGVEILSGYSKSFMKLFMQNDGMVDLEAIMARAAT